MCVDCKESLPVSAFWADSSRADGLNRRCRSCAGKQHRSTRSYVNRAGRADVRLMSRYGITTHELEQIRERQGDTCAICHEVGKTLVIDHCHRTGRVRGLLCHRCNIGLGFFEESTFRTGAKDYLDYFEGCPHGAALD